MAHRRSAVLGGVLMALLLTSPCLGGVSGDTARVSRWSWVEPIDESRHGSFVPSCGIERGGLLTVLASDAEGVLVRYEPPTFPHLGTACRRGVRFLLSHLAFDAMPATWDASEDAERARHERLQGLLNQLQPRN